MVAAFPTEMLLESNEGSLLEDGGGCGGGEVSPTTALPLPRFGWLKKTFQSKHQIDGFAFIGCPQHHPIERLWGVKRGWKSTLLFLPHAHTHTQFRSIAFIFSFVKFTFPFKQFSTDHRS